MIPERLAALRQEMEKRDIAVYIVPTADFHESEYVGEYFKARRFITGFTGSAGTAVITRTKAGLWTDGRYFVQAAKQLEGTTVTLYRMGEEHVPTVDEYVEQTLKEEKPSDLTEGLSMEDGAQNCSRSQKRNTENFMYRRI